MPRSCESYFFLQILLRFSARKCPWLLIGGDQRQKCFTAITGSIKSKGCKTWRTEEARRHFDTYLRNRDIPGRLFSIPGIQINEITPRTHSGPPVRIRRGPVLPSDNFNRGHEQNRCSTISSTLTKENELIPWLAVRTHTESWIKFVQWFYSQWGFQRSGLWSIMETGSCFAGFCAETNLICCEIATVSLLPLYS